jgi:hypothetical protein
MPAPVHGTSRLTPEQGLFEAPPRPVHCEPRQLKQTPLAPAQTQQYEKPTFNQPDWLMKVLQIKVESFENPESADAAAAGDRHLRNPKPHMTSGRPAGLDSLGVKGRHRRPQLPTLIAIAPSFRRVVSIRQ